MPNNSAMSEPEPATFECYICNLHFDKFGLEMHVNIDHNFNDDNEEAPAKDVIETRSIKAEDRNGNYIPLPVSLNEA